MKRVTGARLFAGLLTACMLITAVAVASVWAYAGSFGVHVLLRHGGTYWIGVSADSTRLSPSMRLALAKAPVATAGNVTWAKIAEGFEISDLPALVDGHTVDHVMLARIDPARFRFVVRNASAGDKGLDEWMAQLKPALVVNGSYYGRNGEPDTPFLSEGVALGPKDYDAKGGAFIASRAFTGVRNLAGRNWKSTFDGAENAMVSYPLLLADGKPAVKVVSRWLANRSFVGQDRQNRIVIGTTSDAFFSLADLAQFLSIAPLELTQALNLDGGPVASQGISLNGYERRTYGRWESQVHGDKIELLTWPFGSVPMPIVLAVFPK